MTRGPEQQRLHDYLDGANPVGLRGAVAQWTEGQNILVAISTQLERMSQEMATSDDEEFQGATADAARASFLTSSQAMAAKAEQLRMGAEAFEMSAGAIDTANTERVALAQGDGAQPPVRPSTPPGSTDPADVRAQRDYDTANAAYWDKYHADEQRAASAITALDQSHTAAGEIFKSIHGEPDPVAPSTGPTGGTPGDGGTAPPVGSGGGGGTGDSQIYVGTDGDLDTTDDVDSDEGDDVTVETPVPDPTGDPVPGDPTGPTGPTGPVGTPTTPGTVSVPTTGSGGLSTPTAGGGVAAGLGVGVAGGLVGGMASGFASPGGVAATGATSPGGRGIGAGGPRGTGSPVLGRGNGIAGVGNGAGAGRGSGRGAARAGNGIGAGAGRGTGGRAAGRGAAGSRGALANGAGGRGSARGKGPRGRGAEHDLFDDGQDWLDDEGAYDGVID